MHSDDTIAHFLVVASLYAAEYLDCYPFFFALHQGGHDLGDTIHIQRFWLDIVDVLFIVFAGFLLPRPLGDRRIPTVSIVNAQGLNRNKRELGGPLSLSLTTNVSRAIGLPTVAWLWISTISVDVVVENQLLACLDVALGKDAHPQFVAHHPFVNIAVGVARVIAKATQITFLGSINEFILRKGHEVEVLDSLIVVLDGAPAKVGFVDDFSNIFKNEVVRSQVSIST